MTHARCVRLIPTCCLLASFGLAAGAEKLDELRDGVHPQKQTHESSSSGSSGSLNINNTDGLIVVAGVIGVIMAVGGPIAALDDTWDSGWDVSKPHQPQRLAPRLFSCDAFVAYQDDGDGVTHEWGRIRLDSASRFGVTATLDRLSEDDDRTTLGAADLTVRFAQGYGWEFHGGVGGQWLHDTALTDGGVHLSYGVEWWPVSPLVLRAEVACGTLGESGTGEAWGQVGAAYRWGEVFAGGRYQHIGPVEFAGPMVGCALHW